MCNASKVIAKYLKPSTKKEIRISDTLTSSDLINNLTNSDEYEDVSYVVETLFNKPTSCSEINRTFCAERFLKKLSVKLTKECLFTVNGMLSKQIDSCSMSGPVFVVFSDINICKMEFDVVAPGMPLFYKYYVEGAYVGRKKNRHSFLKTLHL